MLLIVFWILLIGWVITMKYCFYLKARLGQAEKHIDYLSRAFWHEVERNQDRKE